MTVKQYPLTIVKARQLPQSVNWHALDSTISMRMSIELNKWFEWCKLVGGNRTPWLGELGWPTSGGRWDPLGESLYQLCDMYGAHATYWKAGVRNMVADLNAAYKQVVNAVGPDGVPAGTQYRVIESHLSNGVYKRGINIQDGATGSPFPPYGVFGGGDVVANWSNVMNHGASYPTDDDYRANDDGGSGFYSYGSLATAQYLASRGLDHVRLFFRWERLQPTLNGPLDATELARLTAGIANWAAAGLGVVLCPSNQGVYYVDNGAGSGVGRYIGSAQVPVAAFVDFWRRMSVAFRGNAGVIAYDLMNEPYNVTVPQWETASQEVVWTLRQTNGRANPDGTDNKKILVGGTATASFAWPAYHTTDWIGAGGGDFHYTAHIYPNVLFDGPGSGDGLYPIPTGYQSSFQASEQNAFKLDSAHFGQLLVRRAPSKGSQVHVSPGSDTDDASKNDGLYLLAFTSRQSYVSSGVMYSGAAWVQRDAAGGGILGVSEGLAYYTTSGAVGANAVLAQKLGIASSGRVGLGQGAPAAGASVQALSAAVADAVLVSKGLAGQTGPLLQARDSTDAPVHEVGPTGLVTWKAAANVQTTVGAAGGAAALPATPVKYLKVKDNAGTTLVIPAYNP